MARTDVGALLTAQHRQGQLRIRARTLQDFTRLWPLWRGTEQTFRNLVEATVPLVQVNHRLSSSLASGYYEAFRSAERVGGSPRTRTPSPVDERAVVASLYVTGHVMTGKAIAAGHSPQAAMQTALVRTSGAVTRHVLSGGRETLLLSTGEDSEFIGATRVTGADPCAFCAALAGRGPVYGTGAEDVFEAHDGCACFMEPTAEGSEWPGRAREFHDLWNRHASGADDPLNAFRRVLEGRAS